MYWYFYLIFYFTGFLYITLGKIPTQSQLVMFIKNISKFFILQNQLKIWVSLYRSLFCKLDVYDVVSYEQIMTVTRFLNKFIEDNNGKIMKILKIPM